MRPEDRQAIDRLHRTIKPQTINHRPDQTAIDRTLEQRRNILATEADEFRTEGHVRHRRPLSCPHE